MLLDRLGLLIFDFLFLLLRLVIGIGDPYAFQSRARAVLLVGVAGSFRFWTRPRAPYRHPGSQVPNRHNLPVDCQGLVTG